MRRKNQKDLSQTTLWSYFRSASKFQVFQTARFYSGDPAYQSQASFDQVSDEGVHFCHVHL